MGYNIAIVRFLHTQAYRRAFRDLEIFGLKLALLHVKGAYS
jgi:hypothetical protein